MSDQVTVTTTTSFGSRIKSALTGIIIGPILVFVSAGFLWDNEQNSANMIRSIESGRNSVIEASISQVDPQNNGKFIHLIGPITGEELEDKDFGIMITGALLERKVEKLQWTETEHSETENNMGGSATTRITYTYKKEWTEESVNSSSFHEEKGHENPSTWEYDSENQIAANIKVGPYVLSENIKNRLTPSLSLSSLSGSVQIASGMTIIGGNMIYIGDPKGEKIGDMRITFRSLPDNANVSILGEQTQDGIIGGYIPKEKGELTRVENGNKTATEMLDSLATENTLWTWAIRIGGIVLMLIGFNLFFSIIPVIASFLPIFGSIAGFGTGLLSFLLTIVIGGTLIAIAWFASRPILSIILLVGVAVSIVGFFFLKKKAPKDEVTSGDVPA